MTTRERLRQLIDELPESELHTAERFLSFLRAGVEVHLPPVLRDAPWDDEAETEGERTAVAEARDEIARGEWSRRDDVERRIFPDR